ncbi:MAG: sterol desaturase family protein [Chitinophagaceae bacterium]|nr:sterol desaturase family protein [Chitinophagaceae bacterium]
MLHFFNSWLKYFTIIGSRYLILAGIAFLIWYVLLRKRVSFKKIQLRFPAINDYVREISFSLFTMLLFATVAWFFLGKQEIRITTLFYSDQHDYGLWYFWLAFPLTLLIHDTYFYWIHRLMHHPKLFRVFHLIHHKSTNPSPWAAFSFHPLEGILEVGILIVLLYIMPLTKWHLLFFFLFQMFYNVYGHLGWELFPKNFQRTIVGRWINTSVTHNQHHQYFTGNYGLYFLFWDRLMGTMREDYEAKYDEVKGRAKSLKEGKE